MADDAFTHLFLGNFWDLSSIDLVITNSVETPNLFPALRFGEPFHRISGSARESVKVLNWRGFLKTGALEFRGWVSTLGHGHGDLIEGGGDRSRPS
jgi:hypothetical protein